MGSAHRVVSLLLLTIAQGITTTRPLGAGQMVQNADPISAFSQLKTTLSKLYPIEHWAISTNPDAMHPLAPRFCWQFFRPDPEMLGRLGEAIRNYKGSVSWILGPPAAKAPICLVAAEQGIDRFVGYPPIGRPEAFTSNMKQEPVPTEDFIDQALADIPNLCSHLERYLRLESMPPKSFDSHLVAPNNPPSPEGAPVDFVERGMHVASIVQQNTGVVSSDRRTLHFGVTEDEWRRIHADILDNTSHATAGNRIESGSFPLLSRIEESESAYFRRAEVGSLREECLRARAKTSDSLAIRGLDKLILICNWADHMAGDILLRAP